MDSIYGAGNPNVYVNVIANFSTLTTAQFFAQMQSLNFLLPLNDGVPQPVNTATGAPIPNSLTGLTSDPYRGLEYSILKNKNSALFPTAANISGAVGSKIPGLDKMMGFYSDFLEADAYRNALGGKGLPYLSPGDIAFSTAWNLNPASTTTLPNVSGTVTAAQLPGFILNQNIVNSGGISNATLANGALDGNGTFTGITTLNAGTAASPITIGTPNVGFIMELGNDNAFSVKLNGTNTYTGGTSILAGDLIAQSDASLGASPTLSNAAFSSSLTIGAGGVPTNVVAAVHADNGILFNSLTEGNGALTLGTTTGGTFSTNRPIAVGGEVATINVNDNVVTLNGPILSLGVNGVGIGNATGISDLTIDDLSGVKAASNISKLILSTPSPYFYGNIIIGSSGAPIVDVMSDAALGNTTGSPETIGQVELNGGTLQTGASFSAPERNLFLGGGSQIDVDGNTTSWGTMTNVQRTLEIENTNAATVGAITFNNLTISATATLQLAGGTAGETVTLTNGIVRTGNDTLIINPSSSTSLGSTEKVFSGTGASSLVNGMAPAWIVTNGGGANNNGPYSFVTYGSNGYVALSGASSFAGSNASSVIGLTGNANLNANTNVYALNTGNFTTTLTAGTTLTLGDGAHAAGLILGSTGGISGGTLAFGSSEGVIWLGGATSKNTTLPTAPTISSTITGTGGLTFAGSGSVVISAPASVSGPITIDSGTVVLSAQNVFQSDISGILMSNVKTHPSPAVLDVNANNALTAINTVGNNTQINLFNGAALTLGNTVNNLSSTISSIITENGAATAGALTLNGSGLFDFSGGGKGSLALVSGSSIIVNNSAQFRAAANEFVAGTTVVLNGTSQLQFAENGGQVFSDNVTGTGSLHLIGGTLELSGTSNSYSGGTIVETGSTLYLTNVADLPAVNPNITDAGGLIVFDLSNATSGIYSGVISDGLEMGSGPMLSGSLDKDDSSGGNGGNLTFATAQTYTGETYVESGILTLGAANTIASSSGVDLGRVSGGSIATLALNANQTIQALTDEAGNTESITLGSNTLTIGDSHNLNSQFDGTITGSGGVTKAGTGTLILTGASTYTGPTQVNAGTLGLIDGSLTSAVNVAGGATLAGIGSVGATNVTGMLMPGTSTTFGALTVNGALTFNAGSTLATQVTTNNADLVNVNGAASLNGGVLAMTSLASSYSLAGTSEAILKATGGVSNTFTGATLVGNLANSVVPTLVYKTGEVDLAFTANTITSQLPAGLSANQYSVAGGIDAILATDKAPSQFVNLFGLSPAGIAGALTEVDGELGASVTTTLLQSSENFLDTLLDTGPGRGDAVGSTPAVQAYADPAPSIADRVPAFKALATPAMPPPPAWSVWATATGVSTALDADASRGTSSTRDGSAGISVGADYRAIPGTVLGFALGGGQATTRVENSGSATSDLFQFGAFATTHFEQAYISGAFAYTHADTDAKRSVVIGATAETLASKPHSDLVAGRIEIGRRFAFGPEGLTPYAAVTLQNAETDAYAESSSLGAPVFGLSYGSSNNGSVRTELGSRFDIAAAENVTVFGRLAWVHQSTGPSTTGLFEALPVAAFTIRGASLPSDSALLALNTNVNLAHNWQLTATGGTELAPHGTTLDGRLTLRYQW